jgi:hypothetical protein
MDDRADVRARAAARGAVASTGRNIFLLIYRFWVVNVMCRMLLRRCKIWANVRVMGREAWISGAHRRYYVSLRVAKQHYRTMSRDEAPAYFGPRLQLWRYVLHNRPLSLIIASFMCMGKYMKSKQESAFRSQQLRQLSEPSGVSGVSQN